MSDMGESGEQLPSGGSNRSDGTKQLPYHSLGQAQSRDIYQLVQKVWPGIDEAHTTRMASGN